MIHLVRFERLMMVWGYVWGGVSSMGVSSDTYQQIGAYSSRLFVSFSSAAALRYETNQYLHSSKRIYLSVFCLRAIIYVVTKWYVLYLFM